MNDIEEIINGLGAAAEVAGFLRTQLIEHGFTRDEAVKICTEVLKGLLGLSKERES